MGRSSARTMPMSSLSGHTRVSGLRHVDAYLADNPDWMQFIRLSAEERLLPPAPRFMFGPVPQHLAWQLFGEFAVAATGCYTVRRGRLTSDAIAIHGDTALWSNAFNHPDYYVRHVISSDGLNRGVLPVRYVPGRAVAIFGPGYPVYGHWLVDFLPRLHVLEQSGFDIRSLIFVLPRDLPPFGFEFMRLAGIPDANIFRHNHDDEQLEFDELLLPTMLRTASRLHPSFAAATSAWTQRVPRADRPSGADRRLFVSRAGVESERLLDNRMALEAKAKDCGFETVRPEVLSIESQIALFREARQVIGEYGSGLHSTIFGGARLSSMILRGTSVAPGFVQSGLAAACWQSMGYVFGASEPEAVDYVFKIDERDFDLGLACMELMP
jgi:capsular polysaccharide biosynthesis protein